MTVSAITPITSEGQPQELGSFVRAGVVYVVWHTPVGQGRYLCWKPHNAADFTEISPKLSVLFRNAAALYDPVNDHMVLVWDDGSAVTSSSNGYMYTARFNPVTGNVISAPVQLFPGSKPKLAYRSFPAGGDWLLYYRLAKSDGVYCRVSTASGLTWQGAYPIITGQVKNTDALDVTTYSSSIASVGQVGLDARALTEIGILTRTRPLSSIVAHPTDSAQLFVSEPSKGPDNLTLTDNLRGALVLSTDQTTLYHLDGVRQGTDDAVGAVARLTVSGSSVTVAASAGPVASPAGRNLVGYSLTPAISSPTVTLSGSTEYAVAMDVSATHAYVAQYADNSTTAGKLVVVNLSTSATADVLTGLNGVRAVSVANFLATPLIFVATTESGVERLRVYQQNGLTPTLLLNTKLTARANGLLAAPDPSNPTGALVYAALLNRLNVYKYTSASDPVQLIDSLTLPGGGIFFQAKISPSGNIVVAAGNAGVLVLAPDGRILSQSTVSGMNVPAWTPLKSYSIGDLVRPRTQNQFERSRYYFRATSAGTSGSAEPAWNATSTVADATVNWTAVGLVDGVATGVAVDATNKRIYAVGCAGGVLGTSGRVWMFSANGLV